MGGGGGILFLPLIVFLMSLPLVKPYIPAPATTADLQYAELPIIDLNRSQTPEGRAELAIQVREAMSEHGFLYVINHGLTKAEIERIFNIANVPFEAVDAVEKQEYTARMKEDGSYEGYKPRQYWHIDNGVHDQLEHYNINRDVTKKPHPIPLRPFLPEIAAFAKYNYNKILHPILRILSLGLELPEDTLSNLHHFDAIGETWIRFMKYYPRSDDEEEKTKNVWFKGHTDTGTVTILWSQPVAGLQILSPDGKWRWIRHIDNGVVINAGDALEFLSGGIYKATIHRVIQPPPDQRNWTRLSVFMFGMTDDNVKLTPLSSSPVLKRVGIKRRFEDKDAPTMEIWRKGRSAAYGKTELRKDDKERVEEEYINGVLVKHYN